MKSNTKYIEFVAKALVISSLSCIQNLDEFCQTDSILLDISRKVRVLQERISDLIISV